MQPLKTKDGQNLKLVGLVRDPKEGTILICIDKNFKPLEVNLKDVVLLGK